MKTKLRSAATEPDKQIRRGKGALEDLADRRELAAAKKRNGGKPGTSLRQAAKELGL